MAREIGRWTGRIDVVIVNKTAKPKTSSQKTQRPKPTYVYLCAQKDDVNTNNDDTNNNNTSVNSHRPLLCKA